MHGRRRDEYKARLADPKTAAGLAQKAQQWNTLVPQVLSRDSSLPPAQALALTEKLLLVNPDPLVLWNKRRTLLNSNGIPRDELTLTASCLERNPKAYGAWFHRKWCLIQYKSGDSDSLLKKELELCALFLKQDERNFHCWNYRRFVVGLLLGESLDGSWPSDTNDSVKMAAQVVVPESESSTTTTLTREERQEIIQAEWDFTSTKIHQNFSNYSAFHYRSKLLGLLNSDRDDTTNNTNLLETELELVHNAVYTEPDDQTAWWYLRFLLVEAFTPVSVDTLKAEQELLQELNEAEDEQSKWTWLGLHVVLQELEKQGEDVNGEVQECLDRLVKLDPDRAARYRSIMSTTT